MPRLFMRISSFISTSTLLLGLLAAVPLTFSSPIAATAATTDSCDGTFTNSTTKIKVTAQHGKIFYIDSGQGQSIDAAYVSYKIDNTDTSNSRNNIWASLDSFTGGVVQLANPADQYLPVGTIGSSASEAAFFLLKAPSSSLRAQSHVVRVWSGNPRLAGATELYSCTYTFLKVAETIKAAANKVTDISSTVTGKKVGETFTITVEGATGTLGQGNAIDGPSIWVTPAARSSWPTSALRLTTTSFDLFDKSAMNTADRISSYPKTDTLRFSFASSGGKYFYRAVYTFQILAPAGSAVALTPVGQISSGTQTKHTDLGSLPTSGGSITNINLSTATVALKLTKSLSTTTTYSAGTTTFDYSLTLDNTASGAAEVLVDAVVDSPDSQLSFVSGSAKFGADTLSVQPSYSLDNPAQFIFSGPFTVPANQTRVITYKMQKTSCTTGAYSLTNSAFAKIGSLVVGSNSTQFTKIVASGDCGTTTTSPAVTNQTFPLLVLTYPASSVSTNSAVLNGSINSYGIAGSTISFEYWPSGGSTTTVTATPSATTTSTSNEGVSYTIASGLSTGTLYYFRTKIGSTYGETLSFVTQEPTAAPTVATEAPTSVTSSNAELNGTIDPNQTPVYAYYQIYTSSAGSSSQPYEFQLFDDLTEAYSASTNAYSQFTGSFPTATTIEMSNTNLKNSNTSAGATSVTPASLRASNVTVYYRLKLVYVTGGTIVLAPTWKSFTLVNYINQTITFTTPSDMYWQNTPPTIAPTASSNLTVTVSVDPASSSVCSWNGTTLTILSVGTCTLVADQGGGQSGANYYNAAPQVIVSFVINPATLTVTAEDTSKTYGDNDPTLTYTYNFTNGSLKTGDTFSGVLTRVAGENFGTYTISRNTLALSSNYSITSFTNGTFTINKKTINVIANNKSKKNTDSDPVFTYSYTPALIGSDAFSGNLTRANVGTNTLGTYAITQGTLTLSSNYTVVFTNGTLTIIDKNVPFILWNNPSAITYGDLLTNTPSTGQLIAALKVSNGGADLAGTCLYTPAASTLLDAGSHILSVTCNPDDSVNYASETATVTIVVNPKPLSLTVTAANKAYDGNNSASVTPGSLVGVVGSDDVSLTSGKITGVFSNSASADGKTVTLTVAANPLGGTRAANYTLSTPANPTANISKVTVNVTADNQTVTAGSSLASFTYVVAALVGGETGNPFSGISCSSNYTTADAAGVSRSITCSGGTATNYLPNHISGAVTITAGSSTPAPSSPSQTPTPAPAKVKPVIVWKNPNAIKTTTTLSSTQLNAVATTTVTPNATTPTIVGTYVYIPVVPTIVTSGTTQVTTITNSTNATSGVIKPVDPTLPTISTSPTEKPVLGQGTTLAPGLQKMKVVFIPADSTTYEPVETEVEILVQAETKVEWIEPAPLKKNTPVGPAQLNALGTAPGLTNNVPGTYKYDIPEGKTFTPGKYPVKVIFTPDDPNYLPSETTTIITVIADINPLATPIVTPSNTPAGKPITNTTAAANAKVVTVGKGLTSATTDGTQVNIVPVTNFSGKTTVMVSVTDEGETKEIEVPVTVLPLPARTPLATPNTKGKSAISWKPSVNAIQYEVTLGGQVICTTSTTSCATNTLIGPKSDIKVVAKGNDETISRVTPAKYVAPKKPVTALVVYFDTNKFNLDSKDKADIRAVAKVIIEQGFKNIVVNGHTDIRGGVDNQLLSRNRSNSTFEYLKSLVPGLNVTIGAFASTRPAVKGTSTEALASNRRAEIGVF